MLRGLIDRRRRARGDRPARLRVAVARPRHLRVPRGPHRVPGPATVSLGRGRGTAPGRRARVARGFGEASPTPSSRAATPRDRTGWRPTRAPSSRGTSRPWALRYPPRRCGSSGRCSPTSTAGSGTPPRSRRRSGTSYHRVDRYVDILEQAFLVRKLPLYFANVGKRLVKSPKVYFRDTGLLHHFLGIRSARQLDTHPARGASWEAFVVDQLVSAYRRLDPGPALVLEDRAGRRGRPPDRDPVPARPVRGEAPLGPRRGGGSRPVALHGRPEAPARVRRVPWTASATPWGGASPRCRPRACSAGPLGCRA